MKGVPGKFRTYSHGEGKRRAAVIIANNSIGAILITQYSDNDTVLVEIRQGNETYYAASIYLDYNETIDENFKRIENIITFIKGAKLIIATDSNARSTAWHDVTTNSRGKQMEDFVASNQLHFLNEERTITTFQSNRGESNIDLTIVNNRMLAHAQEWDISEVESASDHNIIKFNISLGKAAGKALETPVERLTIREHQHTKFYEVFLHRVAVAFQIEVGSRGNRDIDRALNQQIKENLDIREFTTKLEEVIQKACKETKGNRTTEMQKAKGKTMPWWTNGLSIMRKKTNA
jgi:hypothetical protein